MVVVSLEISKDSSLAVDFWEYKSVGRDCSVWFLVRFYFGYERSSLTTEHVLRVDMLVSLSYWGAVEQPKPLIKCSSSIQINNEIKIAYALNACNVHGAATT